MKTLIKNTVGMTQEEKEKYTRFTKTNLTPEKLQEIKESIRIAEANGDDEEKNKILRSIHVRNAFWQVEYCGTKEKTEGMLMLVGIAAILSMALWILSKTIL